MVWCFDGSFQTIVGDVRKLIIVDAMPSSSVINCVLLPVISKTINLSLDFGSFVRLWCSTGLPCLGPFSTI